ncbi:MAG: outer membrane lipoprotein chaperone LolA [Gammaproteobacteria bacterium]|nr:outer membrane lipoprotein chaperone LolA [Gammaproteobacteria bacterium]MBQ0840603.1 outer membrane lipoprotein chaperone LolA [Gammaproteobacteria bacterium]
MNQLLRPQAFRFIGGLCVALLCLLPPAAVAEQSSAEQSGAEQSSAEQSDAAQLKALLKPLLTLRADFSQRIFSADGYEIQHSQGEMHVARPGKLRWVIAPPMEQWLISDGSTLWLYDPDLEQVIIRPFQQSVADTPAMLFGGGADQLEESYTVTVSSEAGAIAYHLKPIVSTGLYEQITLLFVGETPSQIIIVDSLAQRTDIILSNVQRNAALSAEASDALFNFIPPPGVDILQDD